jgi:hypothetical protein
MGYYIRVLSTSGECVPLSSLRYALEEKKLSATLSVEGPASDLWAELTLKHGDGREIAVIERNLVEDQSLGYEELAEFADEIADCKPASAAKWLLDYFRGVRCIYTIQVLSRTDQEDSWEVLGAAKNSIWSFAPAILQADFEGFSNEDGYHILWQFSDSVDGPWWMGVLCDDQWKHFRMDLGNHEQREAFMEGRIPEGVELA